MVDFDIRKYINKVYLQWLIHHPRLIKRGPLTGVRIYGYPDQNYEPDVSLVMEKVVRPGWVCADLGANIGYFTLLLGKLVGPTGQVIAFEAHPSNARLVSKNIQINNYIPWCKVENTAVSDGTKKHLKLYPGRAIGGSAEWNIIGKDVLGEIKKAIMFVPACALDDYFPKRTRLNFIKMDIEGAEALALSGMQRILRKSHPILLIEFHNKKGWEGRQLLYAAGYTLYDIDLQKINSNKNTPRVYHVLALPRPLQNYL